ncbi:MAG: hypothetical protein H7833_06220 [Magnetococcus sp. DMHC-1]
MNLDGFIRKYRTFLGSSVFLLAGMTAAGYSIFYMHLQNRSENLAAMQKAYSEQNAKMKSVIEQRKVQESTKDKGGVDDLPMFLERINDLARKNTVIIRRLTPDTEIPNKFVLEIVVDYNTFIRFTADLESLDIVVDDLQVHEHNSGATPPTHAISFSLVARNNARTLSSERLEGLRKWVAQKDRRNPFQRFAFDPGKTSPTPQINLTWLYKLSGIGTQDGKKYATIDHVNYQENETLDDRRIVEIQGDRVFLEKATKDGTQRFMLTFRKGEDQQQKTSSTKRR